MLSIWADQWRPGKETCRMRGVRARIAYVLYKCTHGAQLNTNYLTPYIYGTVPFIFHQLINTQSQILKFFFLSGLRPAFYLLNERRLLIG
jgi:hypothetical protein